MPDAEIIQMKLNLADCALDDKGKEDFLAKTDNFHDVFSLRDEIGTCPFIEVHLKLKDETLFFVRLYPMHEEQKKVIQKEMDRLEHLGIIRKGLTSYSSPTYHYLQMGMGMSVSPQIWQQFIDLVFQDNFIKHKQNFDVIMNDTFIYSDENMDDLMDIFKVL